MYDSCRLCEPVAFQHLRVVWLAFSRTAVCNRSRAISIGCVLLFTFSLHVDPLKYEWDDFLGVDVSVPSDVLDGLQGETRTVRQKVFLYLFLNDGDSIWWVKDYELWMVVMENHFTRIKIEEQIKYYLMLLFSFSVTHFTFSYST